MRHTSRTAILEAHVRAAWQTQVAAAVQTPGLLPELVRRRSELLPRFAAYYTQLRALPRRVRRALQRQWGQSLAGVALMLALGQQPGLAATIPVGGACTLADAITAANTDTATGGCVAGSGADTIVLPAGSTQTLTEANNSIYGPTGLPVISSVITIEGQGSTIARDSEAPEFRIVAVGSSGDLTLQETTVSGGVAVSPGNPAYYYGGGMANFLGGTLTVLNSTIAGNTGTFGGGGVNNFGSGTLIVTNSTIAGNTAGFFGGGVANFGGTHTVTNSTLKGNTANVDGGGVHNGGTLTVLNRTITDNTGGFEGGGGVANLSYGTLTVLNSTISGNTANVDGGVANGGPLTMLNSTISGNTALGFCRYDYGYYYCYGGRGGGVANYSSFTVLNSTISGNTAIFSGGGMYNGLFDGTVTLSRTLVSGNNAPTGPEIHNSGATVLADNHNLFGVDGNAGVVSFSPGATDVVPPAGVLLSDILNPTLAHNGGPTQTHALVPGSPALDAGGPVCLDATGSPLTTDQRGKPRVVDGDGDGTAACDIGAFEFFPIVNDFVTLDPDVDTAYAPTPVPGGPAGTFTITATFTNTSATPLRFPFFAVTALSGGNLLLNADEGTQGVDATLTPDVGDRVLASGETVTVDFIIGLQVRQRFTFLVDLSGEPLP